MEKWFGKFSPPFHTRFEMPFPLTSLDGLLITSTLHLMIVQDFNYPETFFFFLFLRVTSKKRLIFHQHTIFHIFFCRLRATVYPTCHVSWLSSSPALLFSISRNFLSFFTLSLWHEKLSHFPYQDSPEIWKMFHLGNSFCSFFYISAEFSTQSSTHWLTS